MAMAIEIKNRFTGAVLRIVGAETLAGADLQGAALGSANFRGADLTGANLAGACLTLASFRNANLTGSNLAGADVRGADFRGATLPAGYTWEHFLSVVVPRLCTAGGKSLEEVAAAWDCHEWVNCPMHVAFGANSLDQVPEPYRADAEQFVRFFDAGLIPRPVPKGEVTRG